MSADQIVEVAGRRLKLTNLDKVLYPGAGYQELGGSANVRSLQLRLSRLGLSPGPLDGRYGPLTTAAVKRFQRQRHLRVDGVVGAQTASALAPAAPRRPARHVPVRKRPSIRIRRPIATSGRAPRSVEHRVPGLPVSLVLIALALLGVGTAISSYKRTRAKVRRARLSERISAMEPPPWVQRERVPAGSLMSAEEDER